MRIINSYFVYFKNNIVISILLLLAPNAQAFPIDTKLEGKESSYSKLVIDLIRKWPSSRSKNFEQMKQKDFKRNPVELECLETPNKPFVIGLKQSMVIRAPLARVESILDDFKHYKDLFPGLEDVKLVSQNENKYLTHWEQRVPLFFVPNIHFEMLYVMDISRTDRKIYRYQLHTGKQLNSDDGLIIIEADPLNGIGSYTFYTEYDFFDADWGVLKLKGADNIWKEGVEGIYLSDLALKLHAEHPDWSYKKVAEESAKWLDGFPVEEAIEHKTQLEVPLAKLEAK